MTKLSLIKLCAIACLSIMSLSATSADDSFRLGYCQDRDVAYGGNDGSEPTGIAAHFPASMMGVCKGNNITKLSFKVGEAGAEDFVLFITTDLNKDKYDYEQAVTTYTAGKWTTITLDKPYPIDGEQLYIGYKLKLGGLSITYSNPYDKSDDYVYKEGKWIEDWNTSLASNLYATVEGDNLPYNYASIESSTLMPLYPTTTTPQTFSAVIKNRGLATLHNVRLDYTINGTPGGSFTLDNLEVEPRTEYYFTKEMPCMAEGNYSIQFNLSTLNDDKANIETVKNLSQPYNAICSDHFVKRNVLIEMFSTEKCSNCPRSHKAMEDTIAKRSDKDNFILFTHHSGYYRDKYSISASGDYEWFYGNNQLTAPAFMADRTYFNTNLSSAFKPNSPIADITYVMLPFIFDEAMNVPAFASIDLTMDPLTESNELTFHVSGKEILPTDGDSRLFIFLTEDSLHSSTQDGGGKDYVHNGVPRRCLTDTWGDAVSLKDGFNRTYTTTLADTLNPANLHVIAFVGNMDRTNQANCRIYNSTIGDVCNVITGISSATINGNVQPSLNGNTLNIPAGTSDVTVYSANGSRIMSAHNRSTLLLDGLAKGLYIVRIKSNGTTSVLKIRL